MDTQPPPISEHPAPEATNGGSSESRSSALKPVLGIVANVTVLTALLIYFGWQRSATHSARLGISVSIFGESTWDFLLRSVRPALVLVLGIGLAGLAWVMLDRWLVPLVKADSQRSGSPRDLRLVWAMRVLSFAWIVLPVLVWLMRFVLGPALFKVIFPVSIALGVLFLLYASHLRQLDTAPDEIGRRRNVVFQYSGILLVFVCLFWATANYAVVEGNRLARETNIDLLPGVTLHSQSRLHLEGPGVSETELSEVEGDFRYQYKGLRLLEYANGKYFLVSDGWTRKYGVVFVVPDDDKAVRLDFVRGEP